MAPSHGRAARRATRVRSGRPLPARADRSAQTYCRGTRHRHPRRSAIRSRRACRRARSTRRRSRRIAGGAVKIASSSRYSQYPAKVRRETTTAGCAASAPPWPATITGVFSARPFAVPIGIGFTSNGSTARKQTKPQLGVETDDLRAAGLARGGRHLGRHRLGDQIADRHDEARHRRSPPPSRRAWCRGSWRSAPRRGFRHARERPPRAGAPDRCPARLLRPVVRRRSSAKARRPVTQTIRAGLGMRNLPQGAPGAAAVAGLRRPFRSCARSRRAACGDRRHRKR